MKNQSILLSIFALALFLFSCQEEPKLADDLVVSNSTLSLIASAGYNQNTVKAEYNENGVRVYRVEGCYEFTDEDVSNLAPTPMALRISEEQYRTTLLVTGLPRLIKVSISNKLPSTYVACLDEAIRRYNAENLQVTFSRVSSRADITFVPATKGAGYLASAGFPTSAGNPYSQVKVNSAYIGSTPDVNYLATIMAHEIGHCIGMRHTDYMNRAYSCNGSPTNEGDGGIGAILIPGTPSSPDPDSWMLACIGSNVNRPFNSNDRVALNFLY